MSVTTRFAPSPTGFLHIGGARTALFNWLYTRHHGGTFRLRIEDTDRARSTQAAIDAIVDGLTWLGIHWDGEIVLQSAQLSRHAEVAHQLLAEGKAYRCYCTPEELAEMRERARAENRPLQYDRRWRDRDPAEAPPGRPYVIRIKMPQDGETVIQDQVQGEVRVANEQLDDMVLLRADGTPTYMLSVVVDDHDMGITHVIRGDDHLNNAFRQAQVFRAMGWPLPTFAHIPLIHGPDGSKLSKRHGALGIDAYRDMGMLPEAMRNYLLRLGWGHGDAEIISDVQAIAWFDIGAVGRSAARFDMAKLINLNAHYLREAEDDRLVDVIVPRLTVMLGEAPSELGLERLRRAMPGLKVRARTLVDLAESAAFLVRRRPLPIEEKAARLLDPQARAKLAVLVERFRDLDGWTEEQVEETVRSFAEEQGLKLGQLAQPVRAAVTGSTISPGIFEVMVVLGRDETLGRLTDAVEEAA